MRILFAVLLCAGIGCSPSGQKPMPSGSGAGPALEVDPALAQEGITVTEKGREKNKLFLIFGSTKSDHESSNYSYTLHGKDGAKLQTNAFSIPAFKKGSTFEWELDNDDLAKASKVVIRFFGK
jgi:hypothetical protein